MATDDAREFKIALCGDCKVGKSALAVRLTSEKFLSEYDPTIQDNFRIATQTEGQRIILNIIDTGGHQEFENVRNENIELADGFLLVFDVTNKKTMESIPILVKEIRQIKQCDAVPM